MKIKPQNAIKHFYPTHSLEMVYFEAIANAIDAGANEITIKISIEAFNAAHTLEVIIEDNGIGFSDKNFDRFTELLEVDDDEHKGAGRLVYLCYFSNVHVASIYNNSKQRTFIFNNSFNGKSKVEDVATSNNGTKITFKNFHNERIKSYDYVRPESIKESIKYHFLPLFYAMKIGRKNLKINISLSVINPNPEMEFETAVHQLSLDDLQDLQSVTFPASGLDLIQQFELLYYIKTSSLKQKLITAVCVDNRTVPLNLIEKNEMPVGSEAVFLFKSDYFTGKTDVSRQNLNVDESAWPTLRALFLEKLSSVLHTSIPEIKTKNENTKKALGEKYPHLEGYFPIESVGLLDKGKSLEIAQKKFFSDQKDVLESSSLDDDTYRQTLEISSRVLAEYILFRTLIIKKLSQVQGTSSEADIHKIIVPMKKTIVADGTTSDLFINNAWLLDDKYMHYSSILSDQEMKHLAKELRLENELEDEDTRPDIAIVFSENPNNSNPVDVVIVELKKLGLPIAKKEETVSQLKQRARKLLKYYGSKIQRIWFYGIVDFDNEFIRSLKEERFVSIFSHGKVFYKEQPIIPDYDENISILVGMYILDFSAFVKDAESRNSTFLKILKHSFSERKASATEF